MLCNPRIWLSIQTQPARRPWAHHHHQAAGRFPLPTTEEWGEGKGEGIPISRANSMEGAPLPSPLPARASQGEGAGGFHDGGTIQTRRSRRWGRFLALIISSKKAMTHSLKF